MTWRSILRGKISCCARPMIEALYLWPMGAVAPPEQPTPHDPPRRAMLHDRLDEYFTRRIGHPAIVMSSGQAAISLALRFYNVNRGHTIFASRWSSHCVWNVTGRYGNPTSSTPASADVVLAIHRYGFVELCPPQTSRPVIEDSCDSFVTDGRHLFPNGGDFEIVSVPKVSGIYSGGLLIARTAELADRIKPATREFGAVNEYAGLQRYLGQSGKGPPFCDPNVLEWQNFCPDLTVLQAIEANLDAFDRNRKTIELRLSYLARHATRLLDLARPLSDGRLPPVLPIPLRGSAPEGVLVRHCNRSNSLDRPDYVPCALVPLHFGIGDEQFRDIVSKLMAVLR
jgi:putative PLP-dependent aminotransferase (TIGR04422 family)